MYCYDCMKEIKDGSNVCCYCGSSTQPSYCPHHLKPGTVLNNRYLVGNSIGEGGFGITYIGRDLKLDMRIAVKEFYPSGFANRINKYSNNVSISYNNGGEYFRSGVERFLQEAKSIAKFNNESSIVDVRDYFEENDTAYIIMEYLEGENLSEKLERDGTFNPDEIFKLFLPIMHTLEKMHRENIIHRDITPQNIRVMPDGTFKLIDFGSARYYDGMDKRTLSVQLKPGYAPIEQYNKKGNQGPWTDVYGLCATIYKCITRKTPVDSLERIQNDTLKKPSELGVKISDQLENVLMSGLEVDAGKRCQNMNEQIKNTEFALSDEQISLENQSIPEKYEEININGNGLADTNQSQAAFDTTVSNGLADNINKPKQPDVNQNKQPDANQNKQPDANQNKQPDVNQNKQPYVNQNKQPDYDKYKTMAANRTYGDTSMFKDANPYDFNMSKATKKSNSRNSYQPVKKKRNKRSDSKNRIPIILKVVVIALVVVAITSMVAGVVVFSNESINRGSSNNSKSSNNNSLISGVDLTDKIDNATTTALTFSVSTGCFTYIDSDNKVHFYLITGNEVKEANDDYVVDNSSYSMITIPSIGPCVGVKKDGTVKILSKEHFNEYSELSAEINNWTDIKQVAVYYKHIIGIKKDGSVVSAGTYEHENDFDPLNVESWEEIKSITTGSVSIGLKNDGTLVSTSDSFYYQDCNNIAALPQGSFTSYGYYLRKDGTLNILHSGIQGWDDAKNWNSIVQFCTTEGHIVGLKEDGTVVAAGNSEEGRCKVSEWKDIVAIQACHEYTIGKKSDGTFVIATNNKNLKKSFEKVVNKR